MFVGLAFVTAGLTDLDDLEHGIRRAANRLGRRAASPATDQAEVAPEA